MRLYAPSDCGTGHSGGKEHAPVARTWYKGCGAFTHVGKGRDSRLPRPHTPSDAVRPPTRPPLSARDGAGGFDSDRVWACRFRFYRCDSASHRPSRRRNDAVPCPESWLTRLGLASILATAAPFSCPESVQSLRPMRVRLRRRSPHPDLPPPGFSGGIAPPVVCPLVSAQRGDACSFPVALRRHCSTAL